MANFHNKLVLNKYLLSHFGVLGFEALAKHLRESPLEDYTENGNTKFLQRIKNHFESSLTNLTAQQLQEYDENIVKHTQEISYNRKEDIKWKYFQYLSLLFTEIYLDQYFNNRVKLLKNLNDFIDTYNDAFGDYSNLDKGNFIAEKYTEKDLNKLAFWNATGSGKTLLMHINIKQYLFYAKKYNQDNCNKIILITPNEGLSQQHLGEFELSNMDAKIFSKQSTDGIFKGKDIEVLEITKLAEEDGDKTVAVDSFETNNLVLIDEGHRGQSGDKWKMYRDQLSETGFAFEYSATFGQAISASKAKDKKLLEQEYAKSMLFDYSYKFFFNDGYGKNYKILNLKETEENNYVRRYFTANLLSFYQQTLIFKQKENLVKQFLLEKPLWIFVGGTVTKNVGKKDISDIIHIISLLQTFIKNDQQAIEDINAILNDEAGLLDDKGNSIFYGSFNYLINENITPQDIYRDIYEKIFNSNITGANLYVDNLKGADGELGIRVGDADYFGVINVGDEGKLYKLLQENNILGTDLDFKGSLFHDINEQDSKINLLIGSKKFSEGWSSWRVSSMGLMNVGKSEGSQIIQLFGRGVRLRGYKFSLKRSTGLDEYQKPNNIRDLKKYILPLETLNIFGIKADYMEQFKKFLEEEGLPKNDSTWINIEIPTKIDTSFLESKLKTIRVKEKANFKNNVKIDLALDECFYRSNKTIIDWYPKVQAIQGDKAKGIILQKNESVFKKEHLVFINWTKVFFELQDFKSQKRMSNLNIIIDNIKAMFDNSDWYAILIPEKDMECKHFSQTEVWQNIVISLLKRYMEKFYANHKNRYNSDNVETKILEVSDDNFIQKFDVSLNIEGDYETIQSKIEQLQEQLRTNSFDDNFKIRPNFIAINNKQHLYQPLMYIDDKNYTDFVTIKPDVLNKSEKDFVEDIKNFYDDNLDYFNDKKLFLLRNQSRKG
ncbi:MAG: DEAD/DEAH box helicase family protein, partial [Flavobacteriaceae bacterium]|nr:DEAD/DEAH box helicase family protein [Flavobacteriaceae bacterium]